MFSGCNIDEYYVSFADSDLSVWSRDEVESVLSVTHRRILPYTADDEDEDDVWKALIDVDAAESSTPSDTATVSTSSGSVQLLYSNGVPVPAVPHGTSTTWNREHIWPSSRGVGHDGTDFTDLHHLRPSDWNVNAVRSNLYFGNCSIHHADDECRQPADDEAGSDTAKNSFIFTPPASSRGDVARALFYMDVRYTSANNDGRDLVLTDCPVVEGNADPNDDDASEMAYLSILLQWHRDDPVDDAEVARNARVCSRWQGNRNPFVDYPELAFHLFGEAVTTTLLPYNSNCPGPITSGMNVSTPAAASIVPVASPTAFSATTTPPINDIAMQPGDVMIVGAQSDNPDWVALVALKAVPAATQLYLTDNAWVVDVSSDSTVPGSFRNNEGSLVLSVPVDTVAGTVFGYGPDLLYGDLWTASDKGFAMSTVDGDTVILHTRHDSMMQFLSALSLSGPWLQSSGSSSNINSTATSALPNDLDDYSVSFAEHFDNCYYAGPTQGTVPQIQANVRKTQHWSLSNVALEKVPSLFSLNFTVLPSAVSASFAISTFGRTTHLPLPILLSLLCWST